MVGAQQQDWKDDYLMFAIIGIVAVIAALGGGGIVWHRNATGRWIWQKSND
jgi:hypothetical protein